MGNGSPDSVIYCRSGTADELRGTVNKLSRFHVIFETHGGLDTLRLSEIFNDFQISLGDRLLYRGKGVLSRVIDEGHSAICEVTLEDSGFQIASAATDRWTEQLQEDFLRFVGTPRKLLQILPEFKVAVADLQLMLSDLRVCLEQVELRLASVESSLRNKLEREAILTLQDRILSVAQHVLENFEVVTKLVEPDQRSMHMSYVKRQIHPLVLSSPFIRRTFDKPLGYAGDYEMVNMMVRDPYEGRTLFSKIINYIFLQTPPVVAHRNRLTYLTGLLRNETLRCMRQSRPVRVLNLGCGPAKEIQDFLADDELSPNAEFTLLDFNEETLAYTNQALEAVKRRHGRGTRIQLLRKSVHQLLKEAAKPKAEGNAYDFVYCAGLFDYLTDRTCKQLMNIFYTMTAPGGLVVATNVADSNPSVSWMEYVLDWFLIYRSPNKFLTMIPEQSLQDHVSVRSIGAGVNIAIEVTKPEHG